MLDQFNTIHRSLLEDLNREPSLFLDAHLQHRNPEFDFVMTEKITQLHGLVSSGVQILGKILQELSIQGKLEEYVSISSQKALVIKSKKLWDDIVKNHPDFAGGKASDLYYITIIGRFESHHESVLTFLAFIFRFFSNQGEEDDSEGINPNLN